MIDYFIALYLIGFLFTIPFLLTLEDKGYTVRDIFIIMILYPLWLIPLILLALLILVYCFIFNKTLEEGEIKVNECKIFIERLFKR